MESGLVLNHTNFKFFVNMIEIKGFKFSKNQFQKQKESWN
jgi:hypothetical protein